MVDFGSRQGRRDFSKRVVVLYVEVWRIPRTQYWAKRCLFQMDNDKGVENE
jgi:hypothetical protein